MWGRYRFNDYRHKGVVIDYDSKSKEGLVSITPSRKKWKNQRLTLTRFYRDMFPVQRFTLDQVVERDQAKFKEAKSSSEMGALKEAPIGLIVTFRYGPTGETPESRTIDVSEMTVCEWEHPEHRISFGIYFFGYLYVAMGLLLQWWIPEYQRATSRLFVDGLPYAIPAILGFSFRGWLLNTERFDLDKHLFIERVDNFPELDYEDLKKWYAQHCGFVGAMGMADYSAEEVNELRRKSNL